MEILVHFAKDGVGVAHPQLKSSEREREGEEEGKMTTTFAAASLLRVPAAPHHHKPSSPKLQPSPIVSHSHSHTNLTRNKSQVKLLLSLFASTSNTTPTTAIDDDQDPNDSLSPGACKGCGKLEMERNCNGQGRIQGGIATVPGFGWWPIKAYRPCPGFVASGGRYKRQGQSMDDMSGLGRERRSPKPTSVKPQSSKKKDGKS